MTPLTALEMQILEAFLRGSHPQLEVLRRQAAAAVVSSRRHTGVGEYVNFTVPDSFSTTVPTDLIFGDVNAVVEGVENGVTVLLYVEKGRLNLLEFATYVGDWPKDPKLLKLGYFREEPMQPNGFSLVPVTERDPQALARALKGVRGQNAA